jgi:Family of unknown function (DUF6174)
MTIARGLLTFWLVCSVAVSSAEDASTLEAFQAAKARWAKANVQNYSFVVSYSCFCFGQDIRTPVLVRVRKDKIRGATYTAVVRSHPDGQVPQENPLRVTVPDLFRMIEGAINGDSELIIAKYDETLGYPIELAIDEGRGMTDSDFAYKVTSFKR